MIWLLVFVTGQRLFELWLAERNTRSLMAKGAIEYSPRHYGMIVLLHGAWLAGLWWSALAEPGALDLYWTLVFIVLQLGRVWVLMTLRERWTTRIIILPGAPLIRNGPYRLFSHPNYLIVIGEIAALPLAFGMPLYAIVFTILNGVLLYIRIREENKALAHDSA